MVHLEFTFLCPLFIKFIYFDQLCIKYMETTKAKEKHF